MWANDDPSRRVFKGHRQRTRSTVSSTGACWSITRTRYLYLPLYRVTRQACKNGLPSGLLPSLK
nr:G66 [uncultured bacterium]